MTTGNDPTPEDKNDLIKEILEAPDVVIAYYLTPTDEATNSPSTCHLAAISRDSNWDGWSFCREEGTLNFEGTFKTYLEAVAFLQYRATDIQSEADAVLAMFQEAENEAHAGVVGLAPVHCSGLDDLTVLESMDMELDTDYLRLCFLNSFLFYAEGQRRARSKSLADDWDPHGRTIGWLKKPLFP